VKTRPLVLGLVAVTGAAGAVLIAAPPTPRPTVNSSFSSTAMATTTTTTTTATATQPAMAVLGTLAVKGRAARTGYSRAAFGPAWADVDRNGCDTRNDILNRDLVGLTRKPGTHGCVVLTGTLDDPYTGRRIAFQRGRSTSSAVQIDHLVALSDAWQTGAAYFTAGQRQRLANDPLELLAVDGSANESKGDGDAASWLPPQKAYRCTYVARQIAVKAKYRLWVTVAEKASMEKILGRCAAGGPTSPPLTPSASPTPTSVPEQSAPAPTSAPGSTPSTPSASAAAPESVVYANCDAVRAAGAAPVRRGDPGYSRKLDRDGDGIGCE
jgi:hypothetical protein